MGPAFEDIAQFAANEEIWIRKYLEAWHMATENGTTNLKFLDPQNPIDRLYLEPKHKVICRNKTTRECLDNQENCAGRVVAKAPESTIHVEKSCRNKHLLVSEQQLPGETFTNYREFTSATLVNPTQSSDLNSYYPASNPLNRQNRKENKAKGKDWWFHPFPKNERETDPL